MRRLPIESTAPLVAFAATRLAVVAAAVVAVVLMGFPHEGRATAVLGVFTLWSAALYLESRREPDRVLHLAVPAVDFALLLALELVAPEAVDAVRFAALFLVAAHAHFQGELRGLAIAALGSGALVAGAAFGDDDPFDEDVATFYEAVFLVTALATAYVVGLLRTSESASRLRAREITRRSIQEESEARRRVAESIHDGPVQELIGLDMILSAARDAAENSRTAEATGLLEEAHDLVSRNVQALRDEIVDLGPYAFQELSFATAIESCLPVWRRRWGFEVMLAIEPIELTPEMSGDLFRIAQEAVANAGRHSEAQGVSISLRTVGSQVELRIVDDGKGFDGDDPLDSADPGHLGLASMRERAELMDGRFEIETSERGTRVLVLAPLPGAAA